MSSVFLNPGKSSDGKRGEGPAPHALGTGVMPKLENSTTPDLYRPYDRGDTSTNNFTNYPSTELGHVKEQQHEDMQARMSFVPKAVVIQRGGGPGSPRQAQGGRGYDSKKVWKSEGRGGGGVGRGKNRDSSNPEQTSGHGSTSVPGSNANDTKKLQKTELCRSWKEFGSCPYGNKCCFAHGEHELRQKQESYEKPKRPQLCESYHGLGCCYYGERCTFIHELPTDKFLLQGLSRDSFQLLDYSRLSASSGKGNSTPRQRTGGGEKGRPGHKTGTRRE